MTPCRNTFTTFKSIPDGQDAVETATGEQVFARGSGNVTVHVRTPEGNADVEIFDALYIPLCTSSLVSVGHLDDKGIGVKFSGGKDFIMRDDTVCAIAEQRGKLYFLNAPDGTRDSAHKASDDSLEQWHNRFRHVDPNTIPKLSAMVIGIPTVKGDLVRERCKGSFLRKMTRMPFRDAIYKTTASLQRVYMDLCGPMMTQSIGGKSYFLLITDEYTRYRRVYFLSKKSEALENFKAYHQAVKTVIRRNQLRAVWTDGGGEFTTAVFTKYLNGNGIPAELTVAYTPQQDGISEVGNRIIVGRANAMLQCANAPKSYWAEAIMTAVHLSYVSVAKGIGGKKSPYELWNRKKPEVQHLRVWGCVAYTKSIKNDDKKWDARANRCMFVGYTASTKIWKFYDPINRKSFTSRDVVFYEQEMYYAKEDKRAKAKEEEIVVPLRWPARSGGADEYEDKQEEQVRERRVKIWDTQRARVERRETDSPLSSVPSEADYHEVSQDRTPEIDDRDVDN